MSDIRTLESKKRYWTWVAWALCVLAPWIQLALVSLITGRNGFMALPVWSDEMGYWRSTFGLANFGLRGGYNGPAEIHAQIGALGSDGFAPLLLYGGFAKLLGLEYHSIVLFNALWVSLAAVLFCALLRPSLGQALFVAGLFGVFAPTVLYCMTSMTELFNYAYLLFYVTLLLRHGKTGGKPSGVLCWLLVALGCLYRAPYAALFLPLVWVSGGGRWSQKTFGLALLAAVLFAGLYWAGAAMTAPYPGGFLYNWFRAPDFKAFVKMFLSHGKGNLIDYFFRSAHPMEVALRHLYVIVMGLLLLGSFLRVERGTKGFRLRLGLQARSICHFLLLFAPFFLVVAFYETNDWSDFRTLAPFLWGVAVLLALERKRWVPSLVLAGSVAMLVLLCSLAPMDVFANPERFVPEAYSQDMKEACQAVEFDPEAQDPFTNTVRADIASLQMFSELHPGMGLMFGFFTPENTGKSQWVMTSHLKTPLEGYEPVLTLPTVKVYRRIAPDGETRP